MFEWVLNAPFKTSIILFHYSFLINISSRSYFTFRAVCIYLFRCVTRIFQGRGVFLENGHFDKHSPIARERKAPQGKNLRVFCLETLKNVILNDKFYLKMTIIREFFLQIRALFSNFQKRARETSPPLVTRLQLVSWTPQFPMENITAQKMTFSMKDFFIFCAVYIIGLNSTIIRIIQSSVNIFYFYVSDLNSKFAKRQIGITFSFSVFISWKNL